MNTNGHNDKIIITQLSAGINKEDKPMNLISNVGEMKEKLEKLTSDIINIVGCLETIENSLYFSCERHDKDMTKPCAMCVNVAAIMLEDCTDDIADVYNSLELLESGDIYGRKEKGQ